MTPTALLLCGLLGAATWLDVRSHRIANALTLGGAFAGLALLFHADPSLATLGTAAAGWTVGLLLFLPLYALGKMGAGDVKLLAMVGIFLGPSLVFWAALWSLIFGGLLALSWLLARCGARDLFWRAVLAVGARRVYAGSAPEPGSPMQDKMPYALAIALGAVYVAARGGP